MSRVGSQVAVSLACRSYSLGFDAGVVVDSTADPLLADEIPFGCLPYSPTLKLGFRRSSRDAFTNTRTSLSTLRSHQRSGWASILQR
jgi:hypothetical protein